MTHRKAAKPIAVCLPIGEKTANRQARKAVTQRSQSYAWRIGITPSFTIASLTATSLFGCMLSDRHCETFAACMVILVPTNLVHGH